MFLKRPEGFAGLTLIQTNFFRVLSRESRVEKSPNFYCRTISQLRNTNGSQADKKTSRKLQNEATLAIYVSFFQFQIAELLKTTLNKTVLSKISLLYCNLHHSLPIFNEQNTLFLQGVQLLMQHQPATGTMCSSTS